MARKITKLELLQRFRKAHGRYYNYSKVIYSRMWDKVTIRCPVHGDFQQAPVNHINGMGCTDCGKNHDGPTSKLEKRDFVKRSESIYGKNTFDYSRAEYKTSRQSVILKCNEHSCEFSIKVNIHLTRRSGCPKCGRNSRDEKLRDSFKKFKNFSEFKEEANKIHGGRYIYKPFVYKNGKQRFELKCPQHGWFNQRTSNHIEGRGCEKCATLVTSEKLRMSTQDFLEAAKQIHGNIYDYKRVKYESFHSKLTIICKVHGIFKQSAASHLSGNKCIKCGFAKVQAENTMSQKEYLRRARQIHGRKYDYSKLIYKNSQNSVRVICKKHGPFDQHAGAHLKGSGCPGCQRSKGEDAIAIFLQKNKIKHIAQWRDHDCKDKRILIFDFYLPKHRAIIEFDGIQHFVPISFGGNQSEAQIFSNFEQLRVRDLVKRNWAKKNQLSFFRIKYNEDLEEKLLKIFTKLKS